MNSKIQNLTILLINLCFLFPSTVMLAQGPAQRPTELKCFDEEHLPPTIVGDLNLVIVASDTTPVNPYPEKKWWSDSLTQGDFQRRYDLPEEIAQVNPDILTWTTVSWEGWWQVGCSVEPFDDEKVLVTVHYFGFGSGAWFLRERSGRIVNEMSDELLRHEQGHFDIVEVGRRRWQNRAEQADQELMAMAAQGQFRLSLVGFALRDQASISEKAREMIEQLAHQEKLRKILRRLARFKLIDTGWAEGLTEIYELQTNYGVLSPAQKRWENWLAEMLE